MTIYLGDFDPGAVIYIPFHTFNAAGASVTISGLAVTDIEVYKNGSATQRSSDAGYTLLDTDGIDFDGITGVHGFSIDTGDNTDTGFYVSNADYWVIVSAITVDGEAVSFVAAIFSIGRRSALRPTVAGRTVDVNASGNVGIDLDNITLTNGCGPFGIQASGTLSGTHSSTTADLGTNAPSVSAVNMILYIPSRGFSRIVTAFDTGTGVATFDTTAASLSNGDQWYLIGSAPSSPSLPVAADMRQIGGDSQSATDLKDFADTGYNPATHKVAGVVLTDTLTTYTGDTPQSGDAFARIGANGAGLTAVGDSSGVTTLLARLSSARAAYLDNLSAGAVATASALAAVAGYLDTEIAAILVIANKIDTMLALDGSVYQFTVNALENAPTGGGGGSSDWTADERDAIRAILGIPGSGTTPADPSAGILDTIRDAIAALNDLSSAEAETAAEAALADYGAATAANVSAVTSSITSLINALNDVSVTEILTTQMTESYAANGTAPTLAQALFAIHQYLMEFVITGTTYRVRRLDSSTTAFDVTLDDDTNPTGATR